MPVLIGICGYAQVGKDTAADYLKHTYGYQRRAFADALRALAVKVDPIIDRVGTYNQAQQVLGYERAKAEVPGFREFLKRLGSGAREVIDPDVWVNATLRNIQRYSTISDVRFLNEAEHVRQKARLMGGEAVILRIHRPGHEAESDFEREVDLITPDHEVWNDGSVTDFYNELARFMGGLRRESWMQEALAL